MISLCQQHPKCAVVVDEVGPAHIRVLDASPPAVPAPGPPGRPTRSIRASRMDREDIDFIVIMGGVFPLALALMLLLNHML